MSDQRDDCPGAPGPAEFGDDADAEELGKRVADHLRDQQGGLVVQIERPERRPGDAVEIGRIGREAVEPDPAQPRVARKAPALHRIGGLPRQRDRGCRGHVEIRSGRKTRLPNRSRLA